MNCGRMAGCTEVLLLLSYITGVRGDVTGEFSNRTFSGRE